MINSKTEQFIIHDLLQLLKAQPFPAIQDLVLNTLGI